MAMSGMAGMSGATPSEDTASTASCTAGNGGTTRSGLDLTNTPYMIMGGDAGMNMNGADASAAAGPQLHQGELELHRPGVADRAWRTSCWPTGRTAPTRSHGGHRVRGRADVLPADQRHPVCTGHQRGGGPLREISPPRPPPAMWRCRPSTTPSSTT